MPFFAVSPFLDALGWALLNSLWQFGVLWCLYYVITAGIKQLTASAKHTLAVYMLVAGVCWFVASLSWKYYSVPHTPGAAVYNVAVAGGAYYSGWQYLQQLADRLMPWWSSVYLICITGLFIKFGLFIRQAHQLQQKDISKLPVEWRLYVIKTAALLGIEKEVKAVVSARVDTPQVIGFIKPMILVPLACITYLDTRQLEAVLLHELIHIKRNDYLVNLFVATAEILFFFNPFVKQLVVAVRREREYSCDDSVIQFQYQPQQYASALLSLERQRTAAVTFGIAASGRGQKQLLARVQRIAGIKINQHRLAQGGAYLAVVLLLGFIAMVNPVKIVADKISLSVALPARYNTTNPSDKEQSYTIVNDHPGIKLRWDKQGRRKNSTPVERDDNEANLQLDLQPAAMEDAAAEINLRVQSIASFEQRDFSLPEATATPPPASTESDESSPYVPNNSFFYQFVPDTSLPRTRGETFAEKQARETLMKAKKAMDQVNWARIQHDLKYNKRTLDKLRDELTKELGSLDWQQINRDVQEQQKMNELQKTRAVIMKEQTLRQYQQAETYNEELRRQVMERDQLLRESQKRLEDQQKLLNDQLKQSQEDMKKKRIVYI